MSNPRVPRIPMPWLALLASSVPFVVTLSMLGLKNGIGPATILYPIAQYFGAVSFMLIVVGTGLGVAALAQVERADWRVWAAFALQALSVAGSVLFMGG